MRGDPKQHRYIPTPGGLSAFKSRKLWLRSTNCHLLAVPSCAKSSFASRAFCASSANNWNSLPAHIRSSDSLVTFQSRLKSHLFCLSRLVTHTPAPQIRLLALQNIWLTLTLTVTLVYWMAAPLETLGKAMITNRTARLDSVRTNHNNSSRAAGMHNSKVIHWRKGCSIVNTHTTCLLLVMMWPCRRDCTEHYSVRTWV